MINCHQKCSDWKPHRQRHHCGKTIMEVATVVGGLPREHHQRRVPSEEYHSREARQRHASLLVNYYLLEATQ